jgi:ABC-type branched-subunit amino acid transport system substrate-binding protein
MSSPHLRAVTALVILSVIGTACSMTPRPDVAQPVIEDAADPADDASERATHQALDDIPGDGETTPDPDTVDDEDGDDPDRTGSSPAPAPSPTGQPTASPSPTPTPKPTASSPSVPEANVYSPEQAVVGITDDEIYLCGHAALIFADAFDVRPEDLNVYFEAVNEAGGVYGRKVRVDWEDDAYSGDTAITAARTCVNRKPFALIGGIGFDQIPGVRHYVETEAKLPYIHHIAVEPTRQMTHSFSFLPTVQRMGRAFGEFIVANYPGKKVGIISRSSENFRPGYDAALEVLRAHGMDPGPNALQTRKDQHVYGTELFQLQRNGVEVVWIWESALASAEVIQQANGQGYTPDWVVFPFQLTLDVAQPRSPIKGIAAWPSYVPGGYGGSTSFGHDADIKAFEAAYAKYRPRTEPNDLLYITWAGHKAMHQLLLDCGPDCNRNRLVGLLEAGYRRGGQSDTGWNPNCPVDFSRRDSFGGHYGGFRFYAQEVFNKSGFGPAFRTDIYCQERFL